MSRSSTPAIGGRRPPFHSSLNLATSGSSTNLNGSRSVTPTLSKPVISLEEWEKRAPLSDEQLQSIAQVKEAFGERPLPEKFTKAESSAQGLAASSRPSTPTQPLRRHLQALVSPSPARYRPASPHNISNLNSPTPAATSQLANPLNPSLIVTPQQFHDHFTALTLSTEHEQDSLYRDHLAEIVGLREKCDSLIELLKSGEGEVGEMLKCLEYVEERSESLRGACEDLLEEQTHLLTHTSQIAHRLTFFTFLETAQRLLNNPGNNLVLSDDFLPMVRRLDECIGYLREHRDFKDAELYLIRYQQCMTRSMTLIKLHFVATIRLLGQEIAKRMADKSLSETASQALLYTKFASLSPTLRPLIAELEQRVITEPDELAALLAECHSAWVGTRQSLMGGRVSEEVARMDPGRTDLVELTRAGCSYLKQTSLDEFNLYKHFFLSGESQLYGFLETLCDHLYDHIRPRILHEPSLSVLCEVCTVLQALMVQDVSQESLDEDYNPDLDDSPVSTPGFSPGGDDYFLSPSATKDAFGSGRRPSALRKASSQLSFSRKYSASVLTRQTNPFEVKKKSRKPLGRLHTELLLRMVLQDAQTRLVFRAQAVLQADVMYYAPQDSDLDYPEKLGKADFTAVRGPLIHRESVISLDDDDDDEPAFMRLPSQESQETWYPTLPNALRVLSSLYSYVDTAVFEDLAQEAVVTCRKSLTSASDLLSAKKDSKMDGRLFLVRHLLILKEMTGGLELGNVKRQKEWAGITDFLRSLLENATSMLGYGKGSLVRGSEPMPDARTDIDRELKRVCEELIQQCSQTSTEPLQKFLDQCTTYLSSRPAPPQSANKDTHSTNTSDLSNQPFATTAKVLEVHESFKSGLLGVVGSWEERLMLYLQDRETVQVLIPPAHNSIVDAYRSFHDLVRSEYDFSTAASIMTPSAVVTLLNSVDNKVQS